MNAYAKKLKDLKDKLACHENTIDQHAKEAKKTMNEIEDLLKKMAQEESDYSKQPKIAMERVRKNAFQQDGVLHSLKFKVSKCLSVMKSCNSLWTVVYLLDEIKAKFDELQVLAVEGLDHILIERLKQRQVLLEAGGNARRAQFVDEIEKHWRPLLPLPPCLG